MFDSTAWATLVAPSAHADDSPPSSAQPWCLPAAATANSLTGTAAVSS
jgi:hypothetical protein